MNKAEEETSKLYKQRNLESESVMKTLTCHLTIGSESLSKCMGRKCSACCVDTLGNLSCSIIDSMLIARNIYAAETMREKQQHDLIANKGNGATSPEYV